VIKKAISISELLTERDQAASVRVLREAKAATHRIFDPITKQLIEVPDHKTRLAAITLELAYTEGRPVEKVLTVHGSTDDFQAMVAKHAQLEKQSLQKTVQGKEIPPTLPEPASDKGEGAN
jgi:hypothetical protein